MTPRDLALALGCDVRGRAVEAPAPGLPPSDRSLTVSISFSAPDGFLVISHIVPRIQARDHVRECVRRWKVDRGQPDFFGSAA
jgi:hypothetical protein